MVMKHYNSLWTSLGEGSKRTVTLYPVRIIFMFFDEPQRHWWKCFICVICLFKSCTFEFRNDCVSKKRSPLPLHDLTTTPFPGSPYVWMEILKERGELSKIHHVTTITCRENLITCGQTNELATYCWQTTIHVQLWKLCGRQNRWHYTTLPGSMGSHGKCTQTLTFKTRLPGKLIVVHPQEWQVDNTRQGDPFLHFVQAFSVLTVCKYITARIGSYQNTAMCTVKCTTTCVGTAMIYLCSVKSSLPSFYRLWCVINYSRPSPTFL